MRKPNLHRLAKRLAKLLEIDQEPSELIEMVDSIIDYYEAVGGCRVDGLDELIDTRANYRGPGIRGLQ